MMALADYQLRCGAVVVGGVVWRPDPTPRASDIFRAHDSGAYVYRWSHRHSWWAKGHRHDHPRGPYSTRDDAMRAALRAVGVQP